MLTRAGGENEKGRFPSRRKLEEAARMVGTLNGAGGGSSVAERGFSKPCDAGPNPVPLPCDLEHPRDGLIAHLRRLEKSFAQNEIYTWR
jgi:hypothetical protein